MRKFPPGYLRQGGFVLNQSSWTQSMMAGKSLWQELEAAVHIGATVRTQRKTHAGVQFAFSFFSFQSRI